VIAALRRPHRAVRAALRCAQKGQFLQVFSDNKKYLQFARVFATMKQMRKQPGRSRHRRYRARLLPRCCRARLLLRLLGKECRCREEAH
jgi:hypothetical protein